MKIKMTLTNFLLVVIIVLLSITSFNLYTSQSDLIQEIEELEEELKEERDASILVEATNEFIKKSSVGEHGEMLTGVAKNEYEEAKKEHEHHNHGKSLIDNVDIMNVFALREESGKRKSYAIYKVAYDISGDGYQNISKRYLYLTLISEWVKEDDEYKVTKYEIDVLQDSLDKYLKEIANEGSNE